MGTIFFLFLSIFNPQKEATNIMNMKAWLVVSQRKKHSKCPITVSKWSKKQDHKLKYIRQLDTNSAFSLVFIVKRIWFLPFLYSKMNTI